MGAFSRSGTATVIASGRLHGRVGVRPWGGSIAFVAGSSQLVFPPPDAVPNSAAFSVWDVASGAIVRTVSGPQPNDDYPLNRAEHFMTTPDQVFLAMATFATFGGRGSRNLEKNVVVYDTRSWRVVSP